MHINDTPSATRGEIIRFFVQKGAKKVDANTIVMHTDKYALMEFLFTDYHITARTPESSSPRIVWKELWTLPISDFFLHDGVLYSKTYLSFMKNMVTRDNLTFGDG